jgi:cellulose synthase/poly-beta-1,6-N-acetylglucosamine synthase-like glycosyltransferase
MMTFATIMKLIVVILFWVSLMGLLHTYVIFPLLMRLLLILKLRAKASDNNTPIRPVVSILVAAHNEEKVIAEKLESVMQNDYPADKLEIFVGSDCSDDGTDSVVKKLSEKYHQISLIRFESRTGKPGIINHW